MAELTIYQQTKNGTIKIYCEDCKPQGSSQRGTLVVSGFDHFCTGCGADFQDIAKGTEAQEQCPVCLAATPGNDHLIQEYKAMQSARFGLFGRNAAIAQDAVATMLLACGITYIPNIFGAIPVVIEHVES